MSWLLPLDIGLVMGLILAWPAIAFAAAFRLLSFPDLTLEGSLPTGAAVCAVALLHGWSVIPAIAAAAAAGACLGILTALMHVKLGVNKFLAGILVVAISYTADLRIMEASNIGLIRTASFFDLTKVLDAAVAPRFQLVTILLLAALLAVGAWLLIAGINSRRGMQLRVAGSNADYAKSLGIGVSGALILGLATCNGLVGGAGALLAMYQGFSDVGMGQGILILALASMTLGERLIPERRLSIPAFVVFSAIAGSLSYQVLVAYALRLGVAATDLKLVTAVFVVAVIALRIRAHDRGFLEAAR